MMKEAPAFPENCGEALLTGKAGGRRSTEHNNFFSFFSAAARGESDSRASLGQWVLGQS
jgi:hypothetical protein